VSIAERDLALQRRASWQYPDGMKVLAEYWPMSADIQVVSVFSTDDFSTVMELSLEWNDVFDISVHPAVNAEQGLQTGAEVYGRLRRLQPQPG
jgi:hypothetical protein